MAAPADTSQGRRSELKLENDDNKKRTQFFRNPIEILDAFDSDNWHCMFIMSIFMDIFMNIINKRF